MSNLQGFSDVVVLAIKAAMAPLQERVASLEQVNRDLQARLAEALAIRDRVTTMEAKTYPEPTTVDLSPVMERLAAVEAKCSAVGDVRERLVTVEMDGRKLAETMASLPAAMSEPSRSTLNESDIELSIRNHVEPLTKEVALLRERVAVAEVRPLLPGPAGKDGKDGQNGIDGKDGADGLGWDDFEEVLEDDRIFVHRYTKGERVKEFRHTLAVPLDRGTWRSESTYVKGDGATFGGSFFIAQRNNPGKPEDGDGWRLAIKRGRDGRDGKDAVMLPVVKAG